MVRSLGLRVVSLVLQLLARGESSLSLVLLVGELLQAKVSRNVLRLVLVLVLQLLHSVAVQYFLWLILASVPLTRSLVAALVLIVEGGLALVVVDLVQRQEGRRR